MINRKELAICKRRGHSGTDYGEGWMQCKWCGIWRRRVVEVEEREDEPPEGEMNIGVRTDRKIERLNRDIRARISPRSGKPRKRK